MAVTSEILMYDKSKDDWI